MSPRGTSKVAVIEYPGPGLPNHQERQFGAGVHFATPVDVGMPPTRCRGRVALAARRCPPIPPPRSNRNSTSPMLTTEPPELITARRSGAPFASLYG
jgi:hypothetical protein